MTRPLKRPFMVCIERTCPICGTENRIVTPEVRASWRIGCSRCGTVLIDRRGMRPLPCKAVSPPRARPPRPA